MQELLVSKCLDVLNLFRAQNGQNLWVNKIVRRVRETTGSKDDPAIKKSIALLEDASMIETRRVGKQMRLKILTPLGQEVCNFFYHLKRSSDTYTRLKNIIIENNFIIGKTEDSDEAEKIVERKLLSRKWDRTEIKHFTYIMRSAFVMETIYRNNIFNSILHRYSIMRGKHEVNEIADKIIQKIMMNQVQFLFMLTRDLKEVSSKFNVHYFNPETSHYKDIPFVDLYSMISENIEQYYHEDSVLLNKSISDTIEEVTLSLILLLQPDEQYVQEYIEDITDLGIRKNTTQEKIISRIKKKDQPHSIETLSIIKLRDIYLKYLQIKEGRFPNS